MERRVSGASLDGQQLPPSRAASMAGDDDRSDAVSINGSENSSMFGDPERSGPGRLLAKMRSFQRTGSTKGQDIATQLLEARNLVRGKVVPESFCRWLRYDPSSRGRVLMIKPLPTMQMKETVARLTQEVASGDLAA